MLNVLVNISVQQVTDYIDSSGTSHERNASLTVSGCHSFEVYSSWKNLTTTATIELPHNIYALYGDGTTKPWGSMYAINPSANTQASNVFIGGFPVLPNQVPLFMRGDKISISAGYYYPSGQNNDGTFIYTTTVNTIFTGYISEVYSNIPIKLRCEDNMWLLKQTTAPSKAYAAATDNMGTILNDFLNTVSPASESNQTFSQMGFTVERPPQGSAFWRLNIGQFRIGQYESWGAVFDRLKQKHGLYFYFRGNTLRGGGIVYYPEDITTTFPLSFQKNIIQHQQEERDEKKSPYRLNSKSKTDLKYELITDVNIGCQCYSTNVVTQQVANATGNTRTKTSRLFAIIGDKQTASEWFTFYFDNVSSTAQLEAMGVSQLQKYYYDGYRGTFRTFGLPYIQFGNTVALTDAIFPERNGNYLVKSVKFSYGMNIGLKQDIEIDCRIDNLTPTLLTYGF